MTAAQCVCGFMEDENSDETIGDHLLEVFVPGDNRGTDGQRHEEGTPSLTCFCGLAATTPNELDTHFRTVFTPADSIGRDGRQHGEVR